MKIDYEEYFYKPREANWKKIEITPEPIKYEDFIEYACKKSDACSLMTNKYAILDEPQSLKIAMNVEKRNEEKLRENIIYKSHNNKWASSTYVSRFNDENKVDDIYLFTNTFYKINDKVKDFLKAFKRLNNFRRPGPDDLVFYNNGRAWFIMVSHEKYAIIDVQNEEERHKFEEKFKLQFI